MPVNLLPIDLSPKSASAKTAAALKKVVTFGFIFLIVFLVGLIAYLIILSIQYKASLKRQAQLKQSIKSLEQTEQQLLIIRDRLDKIKLIQARDSAIGGVGNLKYILANVPPTVNVRESKILGSKAELTFLARSSSDLVKTLSTILAGSYYSKIDLASFSFNPNYGYSVNLEMAK